MLQGGDEAERTAEQVLVAAGDVDQVLRHDPTSHGLLCSKVDGGVLHRVEAGAELGDLVAGTDVEAGKVRHRGIGGEVLHRLHNVGEVFGGNRVGLGREAADRADDRPAHQAGEQQGEHEQTQGGGTGEQDHGSHVVVGALLTGDHFRLGPLQRPLHTGLLQVVSPLHALDHRDQVLRRLGGDGGLDLVGHLLEELAALVATDLDQPQLDSLVEVLLAPVGHRLLEPNLRGIELGELTVDDGHAVRGETVDGRAEHADVVHDRPRFQQARGWRRGGGAKILRLLQRLVLVTAHAGSLQRDVAECGYRDQCQQWYGDEHVHSTADLESSKHRLAPSRSVAGPPCPGRSRLPGTLATCHRSAAW